MAGKTGLKQEAPAPKVKKLQTTFQQEKLLDDLKDDYTQKHQCFDYVDHIIGATWYDKEKLYQSVRQIEEQKNLAKQEVIDLEKKLTSLAEQEPAARADHKQAVKSALLKGETITDFKDSKAAQKLKAERKQIEEELNKAKTVLAVIDEILDDARLEIYEKELAILREAQQEITEELDKIEEDLEKLHGVPVKFKRDYPYSKTSDLDMKISVIATQRVAILHKRADQAERDRIKKHLEQLEKEGWTQADLFRTSKELLIGPYGEPIGEMYNK